VKGAVVPRNGGPLRHHPKGDAFVLKLSIVAVYVLAMLLVGWWCMRRNKTVSDFFLGGRNLGPWLSAFAYGTTYFSAVIFVGYAGKLGWGFGLHTMWIVVGNTVVGSLLAWKLIGPPTRRMTVRLNTLTMPDFMAQRYQCPPLKVLAALVIFVFLVPYSASVYMGLSYLFSGNMGIGYQTAVIFMAALTGVYLVMGGYLALAITDFIRGLVELVGVIIMVWYLASKVGGFGAATTALLDPAKASQYAPGLTAPGPFAGWLTLASLVIITSFGPWALPQMVQKFYSIKSELDIKRAMIVCTIFALFMSFGAYYSGALTHLYYATLPVDKVDKLMPHFMTTETPPIVSMIILLLVFSASMSSLSSLVLVSSSAIAMDLYAGTINRKATRGQTMLLLRVLIFVFVGASLFLALKQITFIVDLMVISWGVLAGSFLAPYVYGLFWKGTTRTGAISGMLVGLAVAIAGFIEYGEKGIPVSAAAAMILPVIVVPVVSLMTRKFDAAHIERCFGTGELAPATDPRRA
jgi:SSS family transporter